MKMPFWVEMKSNQTVLVFAKCQNGNAWSCFIGEQANAMLFYELLHQKLPEMGTCQKW